MPCVIKGLIPPVMVMGERMYEELTNKRRDLQIRQREENLDTGLNESDVENDGSVNGHFTLK